MSADFSAALAAVLGRVVPGFSALKSCERLSGGASQETWRVNLDCGAVEKRLALRRAPGGKPSRFAGAMLSARGEAVLMKAAHAAGVPEPAVLHVLEPADGMGEGFLMEWLEGETLGAQIVRSSALETTRPLLARQCGETLAHIHALDVSAAGLRTRSPAELVRESWQIYQSFNTPQPMIDYTARWLLDHLPPAVPPRLVHGDFRNGNLMVAPERGIVAVLDWELAHLGDPMRDLGWLCTNSWRFGRSDLTVGGFGVLDALLDGYEAVAGQRPDPEHVRFWIVFGSFWWSVGTLMMTQLGRAGTDRSIERAAIGRRSSECQWDCATLLMPGPVQPLAGHAGTQNLEMPSADELMAGAIAFLRDEVTGAVKGRTGFMARVAANSLEIVQREMQLGPQRRSRELEGLQRLLESQGELETLRKTLVKRLRDGSMPLAQPGLADHLRQGAADQLAIDQPRYASRKA